MKNLKQKVISFLSLFTSLSTLICCALPSLLIALGAGAVLAYLVSALPQLVWLTRYKEWLLPMAGLLIVGNFFLVYRPRGKIACTIRGDRACEEATRWNKVILWISMVAYTIGLFMVYAALPLIKLIEH